MSGKIKKCNVNGCSKVAIGKRSYFFPFHRCNEHKRKRK